MNSILELKGNRFLQGGKTKGIGPITLNGENKLIESSFIYSLISQLETIKSFWEEEKRPFPGVLISVFYNKIVAKSNRISGLFKGLNSSYSIVGAKFSKDKNKHIITYYIDNEDLDSSIKKLQSVKDILDKYFNGIMTKQIFDQRSSFSKVNFKANNISESMFKQVLKDVSYIESFNIEKASEEYKESIVTLYDTGMDVKELLKELGIDVLSTRILENKTVLLDEIQMKILLTKAPYLIYMSGVNVGKLSPDDFKEKVGEEVYSIKSPGIEPTIGVIDTLFDKRVYFSDWVEYHEMVDENIPKSTDDYRHGTAVSSIIVDGPRLNPWLDDGCGNFKVRHFGVCLGKEFSSFSIIKMIKQIIIENLDIKVWNLSLGSSREVNDNFISIEASILDQIQHDYDVIFVVAGTNSFSENIKKIGSPADSINGLVVNSVSKKGLSAKYSRRGLVLSFFAKPDVSYYGGTEEEYINVFEPLGPQLVGGTSFAAPWIARKLSYLIDVLGFNKEVAKALIIDSARGWEESPSPEKVALYGNGIVPIRIEDIISTKDDEIKFVVTDINEKWNTYNYFFPIPLVNNSYPFFVKATMTYFPKCNKNQGVDYTNTELNLHFGRIKDDGKLLEINDDKQNPSEDIDEDRHYILEGDARKKFRKWDNVKFIIENPNAKKKPKKSYRNKCWGMEIKTNNRLEALDGVGLRFAVVVTLKEINGVNRIDEFIRNCSLHGGIVNKVDTKIRTNLFEKINEDIELK
ncbi:MAG: S8 family peptidase [Bacilli bacterium]|nr:S8 family peptidase [Bacilli bacterium]